ncbi:MAG: hypothetical protein ABI528_01560 [bacterium]
MNKVKFPAIVIAAFLLFATANVYSQSAPSVYASANKKSYNAGESGVLTLNFKTGAKVKIPKDPGITMNLTTADIEGQGFQDYSGGEGDYINNSKVKYNFTVPSGAASGSTITISGSVKFGYCTTSDGVCKLATKNFTAKVKVK